MKKLKATLLTGIMLGTFAIAPVQAEEKPADLTIFIQGQKLSFYEEEKMGIPFIDENGRTLVPLRKPLEMAKAMVTWNDTEKQAVVEKTVGEEKVTLQVPIGKSQLIRNGQSISLDTKAIVKEDRTYVPLRAVLEQIGYNVEYIHETRTINATEKDTTAEGYEVIKGKEKINAKVENLTDWVADQTRQTSKIDTLIVDPAFGKELLLGEKDGSKWVKIMKPHMGCIAFVKDGKIVFKTYDYLPRPDRTSWGYIFPDDENVNYDIEQADYLLHYHFNRPVAILTPNPFKK